MCSKKHDEFILDSFLQQCPRRKHFKNSCTFEINTKIMETLSILMHKNITQNKVHSKTND